MKKAIFLLLLLVVACKSQQPSEIVEPDFRTGTTGLELSFQKNSPPSEILEKSSFTVSLEVKNTGATDVQSGFIKVAGYGNDFEFKPDISGDQTLRRIDLLEGKSLTNPQGSLPKFYSFRFENTQRPTSGKGIFSAIICYKYETLARSDICINGRVQDYLNIADSACEVEQYKSKTFSGQGAPIVITKIEQEVLPKNEKEFDIVLTIYVENSGNGIVVDENYYDKKCLDEPVGENKIGLISIEEVSFASGKYSTTNRRINCQADSIILGRNEKIVCRASNLKTAEGNYVTPLIVKLRYGYNEIISTSVAVKQLG